MQILNTDLNIINDFGCEVHKIALFFNVLAFILCVFYKILKNRFTVVDKSLLENIELIMLFNK